MPQERGVVWPTYGYDPARVRSPGFQLRPPYRKRWQFGARNLVEFPPSIAYGRLYFSNNSGVLFAVNARTGKRAWRYRSGRCVAASPAVSGRLVFQAFMNRPPCNADGDDLDGEVIAFYAGSGKVRWRRRIGPSETSPVVVNGRLYVGDWRGNVYAIKANTGEVLWTFETGDEIKGGDRVLGRSRLRRLLRPSRLCPQRGHGGAHLAGRRSGAARAAWHVLLDSCRRLRAGLHRQHRRQGVLVRRAERQRFGGPTTRVTSCTRRPQSREARVFVGSYSGEFYAFDAATGDVEWSFRANGPISGSPTVMNGVVYFATLEERTYALDARTGRQLWTYPDGKYTPIVADRERAYLVGYARVYGMDPQ